MACNDYSNGSAPQVVFSMSTLPGGFCPSTYQALFDAIATYLQGTLPTNFSTFLIRDTTPAVTDRDKLWLSVDPSNCRPLGFYLYSTTHATWVPVGNQVWNGDAAGTANALTCTFSPTLKYLTAGHLFIVKASSVANTGATTLNPSSLGAKDIKKQGGQALEGGEILPNALLLLTWRSDYFELLNPAPAAASLTPVDRLINGSFEVDSDGDGDPDGWSFDSTGGTPGGATGGISTVTVGHGAQSYEIDGAANTSGSLVMLEMQPCKGDDTYADGESMLLSFWHQTSDALNDDEISVEWFDAAGASISSAVIWTWDTTSVANTWKRFYAPMLPPAGARFFKLTITGNSTGGGTGASYFDGLAVETITFKHKLECSAAGSYSWACPDGVFSARVTCIGGGGGAGGSDGGPLGSGGAGAGGMGISIINVTPGTAYPVVVGAGGAGGASGVNGTNGGNSTFNTTTVIGNGGVASTRGSTSQAGGAGGAATGQFTFTGGSGTDGVVGTGGNGGSGMSLGGAATAGAGTNGGTPGGGGAGGTGAASAGGTGGAGKVIIEF